MFASWGRFVYRFRWATLVGSAALLAISIAGLLMGGTLTSGGPLTSNLESARAANLITSEFATSKVTSNFILLFTSKTESVGDPAFKAWPDLCATWLKGQGFLSKGSTSQAASPVTSGSDDALELITGAPQAIASRTGMPNPS